MTGATSLSSAMEDYLEVILELSEKAGFARITDIAAKMNIAKASVKQAVDYLAEIGLVAQDRYGPVGLTHKGREFSSKVRSRHRILRRFLIEVLGVDAGTAEKDACLMEHAVSSLTMDKLVEFLETSSMEESHSVPSGSGSEENSAWEEEGRKEEKPMGSACCTTSSSSKPLSQLRTGEKGKVISLVSTGPVRRRLLEMGVTPGTEITVKGVAPLGDPVEVLVKGYRLSLRKEEANGVLVEVQ